MDARSLIRRYESKLPTGQLKHDKNFVKSIVSTATNTGNPAEMDRSSVSKPKRTAKSLGEFNALSDDAHIGTGADHFQREVATPVRIHR